MIVRRSPRREAASFNAFSSPAQHHSQQPSTLTTQVMKAAADKLGSTPSHGNPKSNSELNSELNNVARNTDDCAKARRLVAAGADLSSTNGPHWRHTPLHQAAFHGRFEMAKTLVALGADLSLHSNPCGRGSRGTPLELARGGGHHAIANMLEEAAKGKMPADAPAAKGGGEGGRWVVLTNVDMCGQGDVEIVGEWKRNHSVGELREMAEARGYMGERPLGGSPWTVAAALRRQQSHARVVRTPGGKPSRSTRRAATSSTARSAERGSSNPCAS